MYMAEISTVYGENYFKESHDSRINHIAKIISSNISNYQFEQHLDMEVLWGNANQIDSSIIHVIVNSIMNNNPKLVVTHIQQGTEYMNMLPYFIQTDKVEYFRIIDTQRNKVLFFFIKTKMSGVY